MLRTVRNLGLVVGVMLLSVVNSRPCGDKLLVLGHGVRFESLGPVQCASLLLFARPGSPNSVTLRDVHFQSTLREAGHRLRVVESIPDFEQALTEGTFDVVLADFADAASLEPSVRAAASKPVILPVVSSGDKPQAAAAEKRFDCVLKAPGRTGQYLAAIDKAMQLKSKRKTGKTSA